MYSKNEFDENAYVLATKHRHTSTLKYLENKGFNVKYPY